MQLKPSPLQDARGKNNKSSIDAPAHSSMQN
jgi:hypothetical protein